MHPDQTTRGLEADLVAEAHIDLRNPTDPEAPARLRPGPAHVLRVRGRTGSTHLEMLVELADEPLRPGPLRVARALLQWGDQALRYRSTALRGHIDVVRLAPRLDLQVDVVFTDPVVQAPGAPPQVAIRGPLHTVRRRELPAAQA